MKVNTAFLLLVILILVFFIYSCGLNYSEEKEMNDNYQVANQLFPEKSLKGSLHSNSDIDYYNLRLKNTGKYDKKVIAKIVLKNSSKFKYVLKVFNKKRLLKQVNQSSDEIILNNIMFKIDDLNNGRIFLAVTSESNGSKDYPSKYVLNVKIRNKDKYEEGEPNDEAVFALPILKDNNGNLIKGYFNPGLNPLKESGIEEDWYKYKVSYVDVQSKDKSIKVNLDLTAVPDVDSKVTIYDDLGYMIRSGDSSGLGENERLLNVLLKEGTYYIKINSVYPNQENVSIPYIFRITKINDLKTEAEPNDSYPMANTIDFSEENKGFFNPIGDIDWYRCNVYDVNPQVLTIKAEPTAYIDYKIGLYTASKKLILSVDDRKEDEGEIIKNIGVGPGVYYIKLENKNQKKDVPQNEYSFTVYKNEWNNEEEYELNNDFNSANVFNLGTLKKGYITPIGDIDFYRLQIGSQETIRFEVSPCVLLDLYIELYDSNGNLIRKIDKNREGKGEEGEETLNSGTYFFKIGSNNENENSRDFYILRIYPKEEG